MFNFMFSSHARSLIISRFQLITKTYKLLCRFLNIFVHNAYVNKNYLFEWHVISFNVSPVINMNIYINYGGYKIIKMSKYY